MYVNVVIDVGHFLTDISLLLSGSFDKNFAGDALKTDFPELIEIKSGAHNNKNCLLSPQKKVENHAQSLIYFRVNIQL